MRYKHGPPSRRNQFRINIFADVVLEMHAVRAADCRPYNLLLTLCRKCRGGPSITNAVQGM